MTCAKVQVFVTLRHPDGREWRGENWCRNPQPVCPREPGEDYTKCQTICGQEHHAEMDALRQAGADARGCTATLKNHTYFCSTCQHALFHAGVVSLQRLAA